MGRFRSENVLGESNPNFKGRNVNSDGYVIASPQASLRLGFGKKPVHQVVALTAVGLRQVPRGLHVHHRDCNRLNNEPWNLAFMTASDHRWIHHQFGVAVLREMMAGRLDPADLALWSDDPLRAHLLLISDVRSQAKIMELLREKHGSEPDLASVITMRAVRAKIVVVDDFAPRDCAEAAA